jgi:hypothetical protein
MAVTSLFMPGSALNIEDPSARVFRRGWGTHVAQSGGANWVHLPVPAVGLLGGVDQFVTTVFFLYRTSGGARLTDVHLHDGAQLVRMFSDLSLTGDRLEDSDLNSAFNAFRLDPPRFVRYGLTVSARVDFGSGGEVLVGGAGAYLEPTI